jgi:peptidoglycan/LPS O-acetylase OafA/YrhL
MVIPRHAREILSGDFFGPLLKPIFNAGWIGVELFFVLSGFLIGSQLLQSVAKEGRVDFKRFYLKRSFRILPSYYFVLTLYYLWPSFREHPEMDPAWKFILFAMNYGRKGEAFSHAWSLCIEEHFYLIFPSIVALWMWRPKIFRPVLLISCALVGVVALRYYLWSTNAPFYPSVYRPTHTHIDGLVVGVMLAALREKQPLVWQRLVSYPSGIFITGLVLVGIGVYQGFSEVFSYVWSFTFISVGFGALVVAAMAPGFWLATLKIRGVSWLAAMAFTLYLTHKQMIHMAARVVGDYMEHRALTIALSISFMLLAACVVHYGIERPFLKLRDQILKR